MKSLVIETFKEENIIVILFGSREEIYHQIKDYLYLMDKVYRLVIERVETES